MARHSRPTRSMAVALIALAALASACVNYNPADEPDRDPDATPRLTPPATAAPTPTPAGTPAPIGSAHVVLTTASGDAVTVDVTDASATLTGAISGTPGDGASVEAYKLVVTNTTPSSLRLTWLGGPCDSANSLAIDAGRTRLLLVQPECPGDAIATDRILDLTFSTPVAAADVDAFLQDGLDT
jgi:hypothetical protein